MKKYDVYGIGNALVDVEIEVSEQFLSDNKVEKGLMTLVEESRQQELLAAVNGISHSRSCGGSAANTLIAVSHLGGKGYYSCKVSSDESGEFYFQDLLSSGLSTNLNSERESGKTGHCMVFITPDADRTMNTFLGITATFSDSEISFEELEESQWLYIEGYLVTGPNSKAAAIKAREFAKSKGVKTSITLSDPGIVGFFKDGFKDMIGDGVDLLFCNEAEALEYTDKSTIADASVELKKIAKSFAITLGPKGAYLFDGENEFNISTNKVEAVDTNGAGDLFAGTFLFAINNGLDYQEAGEMACAASSTLVTQFGSRLKKEQLLKLKQLN
ncbi:MAG: adenosine kinase [Bacteriovoracaceae bacterium]|jgi:sugar/nucleoside kinase (ribokinase family)|nr:adenosine kinase [Bacteriovoracaceae bacterium]